MTIDIHRETLVAIKKIPDHVPRNSRSGKKVNLATAWRWQQRGCRGIRLESILVGGQRYTSLEALQRFAEATTAVADGSSPTDASTTPAAARKAHEKACRELDDAGI